MRWQARRWLLVGFITAALFGPQPAALAAGPASAPALSAAQPARLTVGQKLHTDANGNLTIGPAPAISGNGAIPHLSSRLTDLIAQQARGTLAQAARSAGAGLEGSNLLVTISTRPGQSQPVADGVAALGGRVRGRVANQLDASVAPAALAAVAALNGVDSIDLPSVGVPDQFPGVLSEGWGLINASGWREAQLAGFGVKVGIIDAGFQGSSALLGTRLPATVDTSCTQQPVENGVTHGTAVAEVVSDVAPAAQFFFAAVATSTEMGVAERCLATAGVSVVNLSLAFGYGGPGNGTGFTESVVDDAVARGMFWASSAGNHAQAHWSGAWTDANSNNLLDFAPGDDLNRLPLSAGQAVTVFLRWDDPWGASCNDYDLVLFDASLTVVAASLNVQTCTQDPLEALTFMPAASGVYGLAINRQANASGASKFDLLVLTQQPLQYQVAANSLIAPADSASGGMVGVGAVAWNNPGGLEPYSSEGPTSDGRVKPDLVGPDDVSTVTFGPGGFPGTSAASSHVAGAAANIKSANPGLGPAQIKSFLLNNAVDVGPLGPDNQFGAGRLDLGVAPAACIGRATFDRIGVSVARTAVGRLLVTLVPQNATIRLRAVQFGDPTVRPAAPVNSLIDILARVGATGTFSADLPDRPTVLQFTVRKADPGGSATVPMVVTDGCGTWRTLVGAGPGL